MPPKRKNTSTEATAKRSRTTRKTQAKATQKTNAVQDFSKTCEAWFNRYKDQEEQEEIITPMGCQAFFNDMDVSLDSVYPIIIGWKLNASRMGYFTKDEWMTGMKELGIHESAKGNHFQTFLYRIDSPEKMKNMVSQWSQSIKDDVIFKKLYLFTFGFAKTTGQKSMDVDVAMALWPLMLDSSAYPLIPSFIEFLRTEKPVKVINKDQWSSLLDFCRSVPDDLSNYDSSSSCNYWFIMDRPVLFDEFVEWRIKHGDDSMVA
ncbi:Cullin binding-domain-containing protein [Phascolomyces articulosus]|uniref:Defective in cullin neddylation protein n=1 Tax=Phascolomyces articulosus TaxID=60185 RepID=A0AAD5K658_9FUNG|nr:Cullin binding-domain-containing protein [Phascolomyces articulosus]